jgi:hypothetical protein
MAVMGVIAESLLEISRTLKLDRTAFRRLDPHRAHKVLQDVKRHFLTRLDATAWAAHFRYPHARAAISDAHRQLGALCPSDGKKVWLIPCAEDQVFEGTPEILGRVLGRTTGFEYALVDKKLRWLVLVAPHTVFAVGERAIAALTGE